MDDKIVDKLHQLITELSDAGISIRGHIINRICELEFVIDMYIAQHFCEDIQRKNELVTLVIAPRVPFGEKVQIFLLLIEMYNPQFTDENPKFTKDMEILIGHRNALAHFPLSTTIEDMIKFQNDKVVSFMRFKNTRISSGENQKKELYLSSQVVYTVQDVANMVTKMDLYTEIIRKMLKD